MRGESAKTPFGLGTTGTSISTSAKVGGGTSGATTSLNTIQPKIPATRARGMLESLSDADIDRALSAPGVDAFPFGDGFLIAAADFNPVTPAALPFFAALLGVEPPSDKRPKRKKPSW